MNRYMGVDLGAQNSKGVIMEGDAMLADYTCTTGVDHRGAAERIRQELLALAGGPEPVVTAATGWGADNVGYAQLKFTDVQCAARGIFRFDGSVRTVIEIGDRSTRVIRLGSGGQVIDFSMNDRCAAGGGVFLQVIAKVLRVDLADIGRLSLESKHPIRFNTGCAVFGETEAITRICEGAAKEDILAGAHQSLAEKIGAMVSGVGLEERCAAIGGGALNPGLTKAIRDHLGIDLVIPPKPQIMSALGAAIMARRQDEG